jgi:hypothetical protein
VDYMPNFNQFNDARGHYAYPDQWKNDIL